MAGISLAKGGQNRLPDEVKRQRGTAQPCRMNPDAPKASPVEVPAPPAHLSAGEREVWAALAPHVTAMRVATPAHLIAFEQMVEDVAFAREVKRDAGATVNQKIIAKRQAWVALAQFGLTPATMGKVSQLAPRESEEDDDGFGEFVQ